MLVGLAVHLDSVPQILRDLDPAARYRGAGLEEVVDQLEPEILDAPPQVVLCQGVTSVSHRIRGERVGVITLQVDGFEVAFERDAYVEVPDLMALGVAIYLEYANLGLAVVVLAENYLFAARLRFGHRLPPLLTGLKGSCALEDDVLGTL